MKPDLPNFPSCWRLLLAVGVSICLASCSPPPLKKVEVIKIEKREDGITYVQGTKTRYTGSYLELGKNSVKVEEWNYRDGLLHGANIRFFDQSGEVKRRIDYDKGVRVRKRAWFPNGQIRGDETWVNDQIIGLCTYWFEDGRIRKQMSFAYGFQPDGHVLEFAEDGTVLFDVIMNAGTYVSGVYDPKHKERVTKRFFTDSPSGKEESEKPAAKTVKL
jgi:antitoxin component YwqK of YwqJK toxin-antitoxin module